MIGRGRGRENWWGLAIFSPGPPKFSLPKLERKHKENNEQKFLGILDEIAPSNGHYYSPASLLLTFFLVILFNFFNAPSKSVTFLFFCHFVQFILFYFFNIVLFASWSFYDISFAVLLFFEKKVGKNIILILTFWVIVNLVLTFW